MTQIYLFIHLFIQHLSFSIVQMKIHIYISYMLILIIKFTLVFPIIWNYYALANESKIIIIIYDEILSDITKNH